MPMDRIIVWAQHQTGYAGKHGTRTLLKKRNTYICKIPSIEN